MREYKAPEPYPTSTFNDRQKVFLAGSIEMGKAIDWQDQVVQALADRHIDILNPRRRVWDASMIQSINNPAFKEQVTWELEGIENSDFLFMYFHPDTKAPITLLELGLACALTFSDMIIVCPDGFWRKGNVEVVCDIFGIPIYNSLEDGITTLKHSLTLHGA